LKARENKQKQRGDEVVLYQPKTNTITSSEAGNNGRKRAPVDSKQLQDDSDAAFHTVVLPRHSQVVLEFVKFWPEIFQRKISRSFKSK